MKTTREHKFMKKALAILMVLCIMSIGLSALAAEGIPLSQITPEGSYKIKTNRMLRIGPDEGLATNHYKVQQGCCTDGTYGYFVLESQKDYKCCLVKIDLSDWTIVEKKYGIEIDHGNDLTYNAKINKIIAVHNKPNYNMLSFIDPDTLEVVETKKLNMRMYCIAYCEERDLYVVGLSGGFQHVILDADFDVLDFVSGKDTGLVRQGADCDNKYIYFPQCAENNSVNQIVVYDWDGNYVNTVKISAFQEVESMFHVGDTTYIAFNASGGYIYRAEMAEK